MSMLTRATILILALLAQTATPRQVVVTVVDENGRPAAALLVRLEVHVPLIRQECATDDNGQCLFAFHAEGDLLRGTLLVVGRGQQGITWKGATLDVTLHLSAAGFLETPRDLAQPTWALPSPSPAPGESGEHFLAATPEIVTLTPETAVTAISPATVLPTTLPATPQPATSHAPIWSNIVTGLLLVVTLILLSLGIWAWRRRGLP